MQLHLPSLPLPWRRETSPSVAGEVVLITGAAGALGSETARRIAKAGATLALADLDLTGAQDLAAEITADGGTAAGFACDVLDDDQLTRLADSVVERFGRIDVFISSAGMEINAAFHTVTTKEIDVQLGLHLRSPMLIINRILPDMLERGRGRIVIVSSIGGKVPLPVKSPYAAAKAGSIAFSHSLRRELTGTGVAVSVVTPGVVFGAGQAHRALSGTTVEVPKALGMVTIEDVSAAIVDVLGTGRAEVAVQQGPAALMNALQAAAPQIADKLLNATGIGEFWRAVARENGRA